MAKNSITDYSKTASLNTDIQSVDIDEGCLPSGINNAIRELMADLADMNDGTVSLTSPSFAAASLTGNLSFGDNDKAIFGAGSDLQIYHDGSNSRIQDAGTGNLIIRASSGTYIQGVNGENGVVVLEDGAVSLWNNGSQKLATTNTGIDVTGTVTADGLTVDSSGTIRLNHATADDFLTITQGGTQAVITADSAAGAANLLFKTTAAGVDTNAMQLFSSNDIAFYEDTGTTPKFYWDASAERLGIGTSLPSSTLDVEGELLVTGGGSGTILVNDEDSSLCPTMTFTRNGGGTSTNDFIKFENSGGEVAAINTSGGAYFSNNVGIGTSSPSEELDINGDGSDVRIRMYDGAGASVGRIAHSGANFDISNTATSTATMTFTTGSGSGTERMRIDSSGRVGIGTSSPSSALHVVDSGTNPSVRVFNSGNTADITSYTAQAGLQLISYQSDSGSPYTKTSAIIANGDGTVPSELQFWTKTNGQSSPAERMRVTSDGNVAINSQSAAALLQVGNGSDYTLGSTSGDILNALDLVYDTTNTDFLRFYAKRESNGSTWEQTKHVIERQVDATKMGQIKFGQNTVDPISFGNNNSEFARFDGSGNLLVGTTNTDPASSNSEAGVALRSGGFASISRNDTAATVNINTIGSDGPLVDFRKNGTVIGSIGVDNNDNLYIQGTSIAGGLQFGDGGGGGNVLPHKNGADVDNTIDLGSTSRRFDDIFATNGTIQTSDRNEKQDIEALSEAEQRVAVAAKGLLRKFRWIDSVEEKGDDARIHFGIIAQDLQAAFEAEGLDAGRYAMFINSNWTDEETGEERSRMGVRYNQLLAFIIAAI